MKILVARIPEEGSAYTGSDPGTIMDVENDPLISSFGDVYYELYAQKVSGELIVRGTLSAGVEMRCARCSEFFSTTVAVSDFLRAYPAPEGTDQVDVTEDLREEILLHLPGFAVCGESCKGQCAQCGANLNDGPCDCAKNDSPNPFSALDGLSL
ncbi:MAG: DUF177 domain-containing protein [Pontiellaceae bacterium]|nr:DUF177 domain-containing protein [Pontiellaceae bacterium]MBN2783730.1 DUF177 domain-containing protein [Pontiellaceae bacterium]